MGKYGKWELVKYNDNYELYLYPSNGNPSKVKATFREKTMDEIIEKYKSLKQNGKYKFI